MVKRHGFGGSKKTHGNKDQLRMPGSVGATGPAHVFKGMRMAGRMGGDTVTVSNLEIVDIDTENNILYIKGAIPGGRNGFVVIKAEGEMDLAQKPEAAEETVSDTSEEAATDTPAEESKTQEAVEEPKEENDSKEQVEEKKEEEVKEDAKEEPAPEEEKTKEESES